MNNPESVGIRMRNSCAFNVSELASYDLGRTGDIAYIFYAKASIGVIYSNGEGDSIRFARAPRAWHVAPGRWDISCGPSSVDAPHKVCDWGKEKNVWIRICELHSMGGGKVASASKEALPPGNRTTTDPPFPCATH